MAEQVFKSPGVFSREIDLSFTGPAAPFGTPGGVVGTSTKGPAFVPVTLASFRDFIETFGNVDGSRFGPYAVKEFLNNAGAAVFVRVLGVGDGKQRSSSTGKVTNAGFVVGGSNTIGTTFNFQRDKNSVGLAASDAPGRTYFLGALHSQSDGSTYLSDAGLQTAGTENSVALVRGVLFAASGAQLRLSASDRSVVANQYHITGAVMYGSNAQFVMHVSGHQNSTDYPNNITASFITSQKNYFGKVFNRDPFAVKQHGYVLYESFDISSVLVNVTGVGVYTTTGSDTGDHHGDIAFLLTGTAGQDAGTSTVPNFENYEERFTTPISPYVISQKFGGKAKNLFAIESLSDGAWANDKYKISIANIKRSTSDETKFGTFSLLIRDFNDNDDDPNVIEQFHGLSLDLESPNYVARRVGDKRVKFDFDQLEDAQKLIVEGQYDNVSKYIRVVPSTDLTNNNISDDALPVGFAGIKHLVTSASNGEVLTSRAIDHTGMQLRAGGAVQPPLPLRKNIAKGSGTKREVARQLYWGVQFERPVSVTDLNKGNFQENIAAYTRFFGNEKLSSVLAPMTGSDTFNNNKFTLENLEIFTGSTADIADPSRADEWIYRRAGNVTSNTIGTRAFDVTKDLNTISNLSKFTFILQGGFDGTDIFNKEFDKLENGAAIKEAGASGLQTNGPTIGSYRKGVLVATNPVNTDINLLATPGMTEPLITDFTTDAVEDRFDTMYIMDVLQKDGQKNTVTASAQLISVKETADAHADRGLNSNFAAAYFPDVRIFDSVNNTEIEVPPSVVVLGAFAFNDKIAQPWFAAAGFNRGALGSVSSVRTQLTLADRDTLQLININPIASFPGKGAVIFGQKTLQQTQSALDRVNVRRLLIEMRRAIRRVSNLILFEPNRAATLEKFKGLISPIMQRIQTQSGLERFKVVLDETTTSQSDIENHIIRGKIFVQPTRTIEFIALDFIVTNQGAQF